MDISKINKITDLTKNITSIKGLKSSTYSPSDTWNVDLKDCYTNNKEVKSISFKMFIDTGTHNTEGLKYETEMYEHLREISHKVGCFPKYYNTFECNYKDLIKLLESTMSERDAYKVVHRNGIYMKNQLKGRPSISDINKDVPMKDNLHHINSKDKYIVLAIEQFPSNVKTLNSFIHNNSRMDKKMVELIAQVVYSFSLLEVNNINHNDIHFDNIFVIEEKNERSVYLGRNFKISSKYRAVLYDFDLSYKEGYPNKNTDKRRTQGFIPNKDLFALVGELSKKMDSECLSLLTENINHQDELIKKYFNVNYPFLLNFNGKPIGEKIYGYFNNNRKALDYIQKKYYSNDKFSPVSNFVGFMFLGGLPDPSSSNYKKWIEFFKRQSYPCGVIVHPRQRGDSVNIMRKLYKDVTTTRKKRFEIKETYKYTPTKWGDSSLVRATIYMMEECLEAKCDYVFLVDATSVPVTADDIGSNLEYMIRTNKNMISRGSQWVGLHKEYMKKFFDDFEIEKNPTVTNGETYCRLNPKKTGAFEYNPYDGKIAESVNDKNVLSKGVLDESFFQLIYNKYYNNKSNDNIYRSNFVVDAPESYRKKTLDGYKIFRTYPVPYEVESDTLLLDSSGKPRDAIKPGLRTGLSNFKSKSGILQYLDSCIVKNMYEMTIDTKYFMKAGNSVMGSSPTFTDWMHTQPTLKNILRPGINNQELDKRLKSFYKNLNLINNACKQNVHPNEDLITNLASDFQNVFKPIVFHPLEYTPNGTSDECPFGSDLDARSCYDTIKKIKNVIYDCRQNILYRKYERAIVFDLESFSTLIILLSIYDEAFKGLTIDEAPEILDTAFDTGCFFIRKVIGNQSKGQTPSTLILEP